MSTKELRRACPECDRPFFLNTQACRHCGWVESESNDTGNIDPPDFDKHQQQLARRRLQIYQGAAVAIVCLGAVMLYLGLTQSNRVYADFGRYTGFTGFAFYLLTRVRMLLLQRKRKL